MLIERRNIMIHSIRLIALFILCIYQISTLSIWADDDPSFNQIFVNQLGYLPHSQKIAYVSSAVGLPFSIVQSDTQIPVLKGMLEFVQSDAKEAGMHLWKADFSVLSTTGSFKLQVQSMGESHEFQIQDNIYSTIPITLLRSFFYQRCGTSLSRKYASEWNRNSCHLTDGLLYSPNAENAVIHSATGGWHDGSTYGKYTVHGVNAVGVLLLLYESCPAQYGDGYLNIPESGNGIPDILDEVKVELDWLLSMQATDGGFHHKVTPKEPIKPTAAEKDQSKRYVFPVSTAATAGSCAVLAKAYRIYSDFNVAFATECLQASKRAWEYLQQNPENTGFQNPEGVRTKPLNDSDDSDERFWAAIEMFLSTGNGQYQSVALDIKKSRVPLLSASGYWANVMPLAAGSVLFSTESSIHKDLRNELISDLTSLASIILDKQKQNGFEIPLKDGDFTWGSNSSIVQDSFILCLADMLNSNNLYQSVVYDHLHYLLGRNPLSQSYITGFGVRSPQKPYHFVTITDNVLAPIPGFLVAGPNQSLNDDVLKQNFTSTTAPMLTYVDSDESFASNETNIIWNAVFAYVTAHMVNWN
jgi:endoglucanase